MFADLRFIDTIDVAENQITEIQREAFKNLYLTKVNVSHNLIQAIGEGVFRNAENMTMLDMSHNSLVDIVPTAFDENSYANEWILTHNNLTSMSQGRNSMDILDMWDFLEFLAILGDFLKVLFC